MKAKKNMEIIVYADWFELRGPRRMGILSISKGKTVTFTYDNDWLNQGQVILLDPDLPLQPGPLVPFDDKTNFGIFQDCSAQDWGQEIMKRRELVSARINKRKTLPLYAEDFLLALSDQQRTGALRFSLPDDDSFMNGTDEFSAPAWAALPALESAAMQLENQTQTDDELMSGLNMLCVSGASLGGNRPKASVADEKGNLWIAKFPLIADPINVGAWEMVVNELAKEAGIEAATGLAKQLNGKAHTFLTKRFDRIGTKRRLHFASAMTLLGQLEPAAGKSYMDIAAFIIKNGANVKQDLEELWRRIVFNIAVKNTDDGLRNHGFILTGSNWALSPAYDMNANKDGKGLSLNISKKDNGLDLGLAVSVAKFFRIEKDAESIIKRVKRATSKWNSIAKKYKIPASEIEEMAPAFAEA